LPMLEDIDRDLEQCKGHADSSPDKKNWLLVIG
jgi:hypothetical protein